MTESDAPPATTGNGTSRRLAFQIFGGVLALAAIAWGLYWLLFLRQYESTDDAYVAADIVQVTSEVAGTVAAVHVDDTQAVTQGDALVDLDPADAALAVGVAEADLAQSVRAVSALFARDAQLRAALTARQTILARAQLDLARREPLVADGAISTEELAHAKDAVSEANAALTAAQAELATLAAQIRATTVPTHPQVLRAVATLRSARLALRRTHLSAPVSGTVAKRSVQIGEHLAPGIPLMAIIPLDEVWIDANFKEVQIGRLRVGQPVTVRADVYGSDVEYHGRIAGLAAGSGSAFALLPAQNASGNWIKIIQRVPVRVSLDFSEVKAHPLRVGTSTVVRVDVRDRSGPLASRSVRSTLAPALSATEDPAIEARIREIIAINGRAAGGPAIPPPP